MPMVRALSLKILILLLAALLAGVLLTDNPIAFIQGIVFGGIFTLLKVKLMESSFSRAVKKDPAVAKRLVQAHYMLRYLLTIIVVFVGIVTPTINGAAVIIALLTLKTAAYWQGSQEPPTPKDGSVEFLEWEDDEEPTDF